MRAQRHLLPAVISAAALMLAMRLGALWHDAGVALAESPAQSSNAAPAAPAAPVASPAQPVAAAPASGTPPPAPPPSQQASGPGDVLKPIKEQKFSPAELELLQELSKRRAELDQRAEDLDKRELLLRAAEQRVDEKIGQLKQLQAQVDTALGKVDEQEDERLKSLVRIYETMKPKEAAQIFDQLDMSVLLQVLTRMKDLKTAPILASMDPEKARAITMALAQRKQVVELKAN